MISPALHIITSCSIHFDLTGSARSSRQRLSAVLCHCQDIPRQFVCNVYTSSLAAWSVHPSQGTVASSRVRRWGASIGSGVWPVAKKSVGGCELKMVVCSSWKNPSDALKIHPKLVFRDIARPKAVAVCGQREATCLQLLAFTQAIIWDVAWCNLYFQWKHSQSTTDFHKGLFTVYSWWNVHIDVGMDRTRARPELDGWLTAINDHHARLGRVRLWSKQPYVFHIYDTSPMKYLLCPHSCVLAWTPVSLLAKLRALGWWIHRLRPVKPFVNHSCLDFDMMEVIRSTRNILPCRTMLDIVIIISHDIAELHVRSAPYVFFLPGWCLSNPDSYSIQHIFQSQSQKYLIIFQIWNMTHTHIYIYS